MSYRLRFVQTFQPSAAQAFLELESQFEALERQSPRFPQGRRFQLLLEGEPANILIWESDFTSLHDLESALEKLEEDTTHRELFAKQRPLILDMRTEIYKVLDLQADENAQNRDHIE